MRYDNERSMLVGTPAELAGASASLQLIRGPLSTTLFELGDPAQARDFEDALVRFDDSQRDIFETVLPIACDPVRSAMLHTSAGEAAGRRFLAWSGDGTLVSIERLGGELGVRALNGEQLMAELLATLRVEIPFGGSDVRLTIEARDAFALVAVADAFRREQLGSLANHTPARAMLAASDVAEVIGATRADDPRWTSSMLEKVVPAALLDVMDSPTTELAMRRLANAGVLSAMNGDATSPTLFTPTSDAAELLQGISEPIAKIAITVYGMTGSGPSYESTLFARDANTVWTVMISPTQSFVASASPSSVALLIEAALGMVN